MITQERALEALSHEQHLAQVYQLERKTMNCIITLALASCATERWEDYEILKSMASRIVGRDAKYPELRTHGHYEVLVNFIDWLLPEREQAS